jgi:hypothetical protein
MKKRMMLCLFVIIVSALSCVVYARDTVFSTPTTIAMPTDTINYMKLTDLDDDGNMDVVFSTNNPQRYIGWYENSGNSIDFTLHTLYNATLNGCTYPEQLQIADFNLDGNKDILFDCSTNNTIWYLKNDGSETFTPVFIALWDVYGLGGIYASDINNDNYTDIVSATSAGYQRNLTWYENNHNDTFTQHNIFGTSSTWNINSLVAEDFDNDGDIDIIPLVYTGDSSYSLYIFKNNGSQYFAISSTHGTCGGNINDVGDIDGDGYLDFIVPCTNNEVVYLYKNNWSAFFSSSVAIDNIHLYPEYAFIGDMDVDGSNDIVMGAGTVDYVNWYDNVNGDASSFPVRFIDYSVFGNSKGGVGDMDGDGDSDVVVYQSDVPKRLVWFKNQPESAVRISDYYIDYYYESDSFDYTDNFINHNAGGYDKWSLTHTCFPTYPITPSPFGGGAFGVNNSCIGGGSNVLFKNQTLFLHNDNYLFVYNYSYDYDDAVHSGGKSFEIIFYSSDNVVNGSYYRHDTSITFTHGYSEDYGSSYDYSSYQQYYSNCDNNALLGGCRGCVLQTLNNTVGTRGKFIIEINLDDGLYSWYAFNSSWGCYNYPLGTNFSSIVSYSMSTSSLAGENLHMYVDDVMLTKGDVLVAGESPPVTPSGGNCTDTDANNYFVKGTVTINSTYNYVDECVRDSGFPCSTEVVEYYCSGGEMTAEAKDCKDYGSGYECVDGACVAYESAPNITAFVSYVNNTGYGFGGDRHYEMFGHSYSSKYLGMYWYINYTDISCHDIFMAVDCDTATLPSVSTWYNVTESIVDDTLQIDTRKFNCSWSAYNNYTSMIYITKAGNYGDYSEYAIDTVTVRQCTGFWECPLGYYCSSEGWCYLPTNNTNCTDTDAHNYTVKGTVTLPIMSINDSCYSAGVVQEYYCDSGNPNGYNSELYSCGLISGVCSLGACVASNDTIPVNIYVEDYDTTSLISGMSYSIVKNSDGSVAKAGTVSNGAISLTMDVGDVYTILLTDSTGAYKNWREELFIPISTYVIYMEKHCSASVNVSGCVFNDDFAYTDSPLHHGWDFEEYSTYYSGEFGYVLDINTSHSLFDTIITFPKSTAKYQTIEYGLVMADSEPSSGQAITVELAGFGLFNNILAVAYDTGLVGTSSVYYFDGTGFWKNIPINPTYLPTKEITTKILYSKSLGIADIYIDVLTSGSYVLYASHVQVIKYEGIATDLEKIRFSNIITTNYKHIYVTRLSVTQSEDASGGTGTPTEGTSTTPSSSDLSSPFYLDTEGKMKFDKTKCAGWKSYIMCAISKYSVAKVAQGTSWVFSGVHILYFILVMTLIILFMPFIIHLIKKN